MKALKIIVNALNGRFGKYVLKKKYRCWWQCITYGTIILLLVMYVLVPVSKWWSGIVDSINYAQWYA